MGENLKACLVEEKFRIQRSGHFTELWFGNSRTKMPVKMNQIDNTSKFQFMFCQRIFSSDPSPVSVRVSLASLILILSSSIATLAKAEIRADSIRDYFSRISQMDGYSGNADWKLKSCSSSSQESDYIRLTSMIPHYAYNLYVMNKYNLKIA